WRVASRRGCGLSSSHRPHRANGRWKEASSEHRPLAAGAQAAISRPLVGAALRHRAAPVSREQMRTNSPDFPPPERGNSRLVRVRDLGETGEGASLRPVFTALSWWALYGLKLPPLPCEGD